MTWPLTSVSLADHLLGVALLKEDLRRVVDALADSMTEYGETAVRNHSRLTDALDDLLPLKSFGYKYLVVSHEGWCLIVSDMNAQTAHSETLVLSKPLSCVALDIVATGDSKQFHYFENGALIRAVTCYKDGGQWFFAQRGEPLLFECTQDYIHPITKRRLTVNRVREYAEAVTGIGFPVPFTAIENRECCIVQRSTASLRVPIIEYTTVESSYNELFLG